MMINVSGSAMIAISTMSERIELRLPPVKKSSEVVDP
jgi:hypothetical protein